ncbi:MAG: PorV/PorQ family protein [Candidatus Marinimicrobia bacterium]|nr:PorV/PorQ family protein [Candidatus Neomarinimicrobiota bacterium]
MFSPKIILAFRLVLFISFGSTLIAQSAFNKVGTTGVLFLNLPAGAAAQGMGKAYSGMEQGASAAFWNPALLGWETSTQTFIAYSNWLIDLHHQTAALSFRLGDFGVGISQRLVTTAAMTETTTLQPRGTGERFSYQDLALGLSISRAFSDRFALGGTVKYIRESVADLHASGMAIDIGSFYWLGFRDMRFYMVLRNFGPDLAFGGTFLDTHVKGNVKEEVELSYGAFSLPVSFSLGTAATVWKTGTHSLVLAFEANHPADYSPRLNIGAEYKYGKSLILRSGYGLNYEQESWSLGCGMKVKNIFIDIAYSAMEDFSGILSYSMRYAFP